jgi:hypothetical protein
MISVRRLQQGPVSYDEFRQLVRRFRRSDILRAVASLAVQMQRAELQQGPSVPVPNYVGEFSLAGVARTALIAGNEHRDQPLSPHELVLLCGYYVNVADPGLKDMTGLDRLRQVMSRIAFEQFGFQYSVMENVGRTLSLLLDQANRCEGAPTAEEWIRTLGVPLEGFMRTGFALHVAIVQNNGAISRQLLRADHVARIFAPLSADDALGIADRLFVAAPEQHAAWGREREVAGREKWSPNPLQNWPLVAIGDDLVGPSPRYIIDRITPTGLYFIGLDAVGPRFTDALGCMFERYVGTQLRLLRHATVYDEVVYGSPERRTTDFFVVTDEVVVLVEAKASRPVLATRVGQPAGDEDIAAKIGNARSQILATAKLIEDGHPAVAHIPNDRPLRGLVVTLEPFHLVPTFLYEDVLGDASLPITITSAHELEGVVATLAERSDGGERLLRALTPEPDSPPSLWDAVTGLTPVPNPSWVTAGTASLRACASRRSRPGSAVPAVTGPGAADQRPQTRTALANASQNATTCRWLAGVRLVDTLAA